MPAVHDNLAQALIASGWCPPDESLADELRSPRFGDDLWPLLREVGHRWSSRATRAAERQQASRLIQLHDWFKVSGACLTFGWPGLSERPFAAWISPRLLWWPRAVPEGRKVAWLSSRIGRAIDQRDDWFAVLRTAAAKLDPRHDLLLTSPHTTTDRFLARAACLFGLRWLRIVLPSEVGRIANPSHKTTAHSEPTLPSLIDWLTRLRRHLFATACAESRHEDSVEYWSTFLSPPLTLEAALPSELATCCTPLADRILVVASDQLVVFQLRGDGNLHRLLRARLDDDAWPVGSVRLALGPQLVPAELAEQLQDQGAVGWVLLDACETRDATSSPKTIPMPGTDHPLAPSIAMPIHHSEDFLIHCTRRRAGPWLEQSTDEFLDDLLLGHDEFDHSAFGTLARIVRQRRLIASTEGIRGEFRVVSFTATPLHELSQRRVFRRHRGRWDFEPYGVCVCRTWLESRNVRPVIYGNDDLWPSLSAADQPFFQLGRTRARDAKTTVDWTSEAEWRMLGDVDLAAAPPDALRVFVPTTDEARQLATISPWPVIVLTSNRKRLLRR